jgi:hypothetical protein
MKHSALRLLMAACLAAVMHTEFASAETTAASSDAISGSESLASHHDQEMELAMKLNNPVASLISVPIQNNWDFGIGPRNATRYTANVQPVIPFHLSDDWNLITRTILPVIDAEAPVIGTQDLSGLGDITQSFFFSPQRSIDGWILGAGPAMLYPSATKENLGTGKWGAGPTFVGLRQDGGWTYGLLANQLWSYAGDSDRTDVRSLFLQPFLTYTTKSYTSFALNTESTYDWETRGWTVPLNFVVTQLVKVAKQPINFGVGYRVYTDTPQGGPDWGVRFAVTFLFPT